MPSLKAPQGFEAGPASRQPCEPPVWYSLDDLNRKYRMEVREPGSSEEEEPLLLPKSAKRSSSFGSLSAAGTLSKSPSKWARQSLTGGWSDRVSLRLQNSGSVARDHLALERTFLAYMRTSLTIASAGVALVQLFSTSGRVDAERAQNIYRPLGATVVGAGIIVLAIGFVRYFMVQAALIKGFFPVARFGVVFIAIVLTLLVTVIFAMLASGELEFDGLWEGPL